MSRWSTPGVRLSANGSGGARMAAQGLTGPHDAEPGRSPRCLVQERALADAGLAVQTSTWLRPDLAFTSAGRARARPPGPGERTAGAGSAQKAHGDETGSAAS